MTPKKWTKYGILFGAVLGIGSLSLARTARAEFTINMYQNGPNVEADGSGSLNLGGLTYDCYCASYPQEASNSGTLILVPPTSGEPEFYYGLNASGTNVGVSGPASFGSGGLFIAQFGSGDIAGIYGGGGGDIVVGYSQGLGGSDGDGGYAGPDIASLSGTNVFENTTLAAMGADLGTYTWTWGSGNDADSLTIIVSETKVPEPASLALMGVGVLGLGVVRRVRARKGTGRRAARSRAIYGGPLLARSFAPF